MVQIPLFSPENFHLAPITHCPNHKRGFRKGKNIIANATAPRIYPLIDEMLVQDCFTSCLDRQELHTRYN
jgi:hypothetical protein